MSIRELSFVSHATESAFFGIAIDIGLMVITTWSLVAWTKEGRFNRKLLAVGTVLLVSSCGLDVIVIQREATAGVWLSEFGFRSLLLPFRLVWGIPFVGIAAVRLLEW